MPVTYKEPTYKEVLCWTADTKIKYAPNPKSGKSYHRYEAYMKAKTPAEAIALGSYPQDLFFDYEHGYIKVIGGKNREQPLNPKDENDSWTKLDKILAKMHRSWLTWKATFEVAESMGVDRRQLTSDKAGAESTLVRAKRLEANEMAKMILEEAKQKNRKITDRDVLAVLRLWGFKENSTRQNVMQEGQSFVYSDTLGLVAGYDGSVMVTAATTEYSAVSQVFTGWLKDHLPAEFKKHGFGFSSINVNASYAAALHRDGNNEGPSFIKAFGDFKGGEINYWPTDDKTRGPVEKLCKRGDGMMTVDLSKNMLLFDGNRGHSVEDFQGERFSLVFFCTGLYHKANKTVKSELERCGICFPTQEGMAFARKILDSSAKKSAKKSDQAAGFGLWPHTPKEVGTNFLTEAKVKEAKKRVKKNGDVEQECNDTTFVGHKIKYVTLEDGRRSVKVYLIGESGGSRLAVSADEDKVGSGHYTYEKLASFPKGPALKTHRMADVREWIGKVVKTGKDQPKVGTKRCIRSNGAEDESPSTQATKRMRNAGA